MSDINKVYVFTGYGITKAVLHHYMFFGAFFYITPKGYHYMLTREDVKRISKEDYEYYLSLKHE